LCVIISGWFDLLCPTLLKRIVKIGEQATPADPEDMHNITLDHLFGVEYVCNIRWYHLPISKRDTMDYLKIKQMNQSGFKAEN
jgi:hypothetical protein